MPKHKIKHKEEEFYVSCQDCDIPDELRAVLKEAGAESITRSGMVWISDAADSCSIEDMRKIVACFDKYTNTVYPGGA